MVVVYIGVLVLIAFGGAGYLVTKRGVYGLVYVESGVCLTLTKNIR
jgi:hypothetical protein